MDNTTRLSRIEAMIRQPAYRPIIPNEAPGLSKIKQMVIDREIAKLRDSYKNQWVTNTNEPLCETVRAAMEFVEQMIGDYTKVLELPQSGGLKKQIVVDLVMDATHASRDEIIHLVDTIADVANGNHKLNHKSMNITVVRKNGGTIKALKKRLGI